MKKLQIFTLSCKKGYKLFNFPAQKLRIFFSYEKIKSIMFSFKKLQIIPLYENAYEQFVDMNVVALGGQGGWIVPPPPIHL